MAALDRYDRWEAGLDQCLSAGLAPPPIEELYDAATWRAIDDGAAESPARAGGWRGGVAAGAVMAGMMSGVRVVLGTDDDDAVVETEDTQPTRRLEPVSVYLAWGDPAASVAIVRPWLF